MILKFTTRCNESYKGRNVTEMNVLIELCKGMIWICKHVWHIYCNIYDYRSPNCICNLLAKYIRRITSWIDFSHGRNYVKLMLHNTPFWLISNYYLSLRWGVGEWNKRHHHSVQGQILFYSHKPKVHSLWNPSPKTRWCLQISIPSGQGLWSLKVWIFSHQICIKVFKIRVGIQCRGVQGYIPLENFEI